MQHDTIVITFYDRIENVIECGEIHPRKKSPEVKRTTPGTGRPESEEKANSQEGAIKTLDVGATQRMVDGIDLLMKCNGSAQV